MPRNQLEHSTEFRDEDPEFEAVRENLATLRDQTADARLDLDGAIEQARQLQFGTERDNPGEADERQTEARLEQRFHEFVSRLHMADDYPNPEPRNEDWLYTLETEVTERLACAEKEAEFYLVIHQDTGLDLHGTRLTENRCRVQGVNYPTKAGYPRFRQAMDGFVKQYANGDTDEQAQARDQAVEYLTNPTNQVVQNEFIRWATAKQTDFPGLNRDEYQPNHRLDYEAATDVAEKLEQNERAAQDADDSANRMMHFANGWRNLNRELDQVEHTLNDPDPDEPLTDRETADLHRRRRAVNEQIRLCEMDFRHHAQELKVLSGPNDHSVHPLNDADYEKLQHIPERTRRNLLEADLYISVYEATRLDMVGEPVNHPQVVWGNNFPNEIDYPTLHGELTNLIEDYRLSPDTDERQQLHDQLIQTLTSPADSSLTAETAAWRRATGQTNRRPAEAATV